MHIAGRTAWESQDRGELALSGRAAAKENKNDFERQMYESAFQSLDKFLARMREQSVHVVIFEGRSSPAPEAEAQPSLRADTRDRIHNLCEQYGASYVPVTEQAVDIGPDDWLDRLHLNAGGGRSSRGASLII